jgi:branched-chain amino acid aminotransferase
MQIYLNGNMVDPESAQVNIQDAGIQHGIGLFETMAAHHGNVFRLSEHIERLLDSAQTLGLTACPNGETLENAVKTTLKHNNLEEARVRLTVTAGDFSTFRPSLATDSDDEQSATAASPMGIPNPTVAVVATESTIYDPAFFDQGITAIIAGPGANPFDVAAGHKTLNYWSRLSALRKAASVGAGEAIWLNITNHLASGCVSNVFLTKEGQLLTPYARGEEVEGAMPAPVLPGITRKAVIDLAEKAGVTVVRKMLSVEDLLSADEVFLTNSGWQLLPVTTIEKHKIGEGNVGPFARQLRENLLALIEQETKA